MQKNFEKTRKFFLRLAQRYVTIIEYEKYAHIA